MEILARYSERPRVNPDVGTESRAKQSFKDEADINNIMQKYQRTGVLTGPGATRQPMFGDFSEGESFSALQNRIAQVHSDFEALPSDIREGFKNDPAVMLDWMADPKNSEEAAKMGLIPQNTAQEPKTEVKPDTDPPEVETPAESE